MTYAVVTPKRLLLSTPNTLGGKRNQAHTIFRELAAAGYPPGRGHTLVDPFFGGGSVALLGKLLGFRVVAGDTSPRAEAVGTALLSNDRVELEPEDVAIALTTDPDGWFLPSLKQLPWPENSRQLLAGICRAASVQADPSKAALLRSLMVKLASHLSIYGQPRMTAHQRIRDQNWDALTEGQIARMLPNATKPKEMARRSAKAMYGVVFSNGQKNTFTRGDCLALLADTPADVAYLDPPYPDTEGYSRNYVGIDSILEGRELVVDESRFSQPAGWKHLADVLEASAHIPVLVLSLGAENVHVSSAELEELMLAAGRNVRTATIAYTLLRSRATAKSARKKEFLLVGTRPTGGQ